MERMKMTKTRSMDDDGRLMSFLCVEMDHEYFWGSLMEEAKNECESLYSVAFRLS